VVPPSRTAAMERGTASLAVAFFIAILPSVVELQGCVTVLHGKTRV